VEKALQTLLREPVTIVAAGRTDAGVHASDMAAHFDFHEKLDAKQTIDKLNKLLPADIAVIQLRQTVPDAHARFDALSRTYRYYLSTKKNPFWNEFSYSVTRTFDFTKMNEAAQILSEYTDFTSFSKLHTDVKTNNCKIFRAEWTQETEDRWVFTISADRFLRNMVRAIVGTLLEVGKGKLSPAGFREIIEMKDRGKAGTSVPGKALFLVNIAYPDTLFLTS
jgi:tRNA pseudouridine38-40 synthase